MRAYLLAAHDADLRYLERAGDGHPLVFIHGLGCASSFEFPHVISHPALNQHHVILVDLLGSGYSDRPVDFGYQVREHAETIVDFIQVKGLEQVVLVGHSMGGAVAIQAATLLMSTIHSLILLEPNLDSGGGVFSQAIASLPEDTYVAEGHLKNIQEARDSGYKAWATTMQASDSRAVHREAVSLVDGCSPSWRTQLASLDVPRSVIFGALSLPDPDVDELRTLGVSTLIVQNAGHSLAMENPGGLAVAISESLSRTSDH